MLVDIAVCLKQMQRATWEESRRELVQRHRHDFGCEAEGVLHTCRAPQGETNHRQKRVRSNQILSESQMSLSSACVCVCYHRHDAGQRPHRGLGRISPSA